MNIEEERQIWAILGNFGQVRAILGKLDEVRTRQQIRKMKKRGRNNKKWE